MTTASTVRNPMSTAYFATNALLVVLVLVQAIMAGQGLYGGTGFEVHGYIGNASFAVGLVAAVLSFLSKTGKGFMTASALLLLALFAQTGLGYVARDSDSAGLIHVPLGVATFGLAIGVTVALAVRRGLIR